MRHVVYRKRKQLEVELTLRGPRANSGLGVGGGFDASRGISKKKTIYSDTAACGGECVFVWKWVTLKIQPLVLDCQFV
jgi:hypothetical protein